MSRVLKLLAEGDLDPRRAGGDEIYRWTREAVPWQHLLRQEQTLAVEARVRRQASLNRYPLISNLTFDTLMSKPYE